MMLLFTDWDGVFRWASSGWSVDSDMWTAGEPDTEDKNCTFVQDDELRGKRCWGGIYLNVRCVRLSVVCGHCLSHIVHGNTSDVFMLASSFMFEA